MRIITFLILLLLSTFSYSQVLLTIDPNSAEQGETLDVTLTGDNTHFTQASGTTLSFTFEQASSTIVNSYNLIDDETLTANISIPIDVNPGTYSISTYNEVDGLLNLENCFNVISPTNMSCTPDTIYQDSVFGIWPNPQENFLPGDIDVEYSQVINFKIPDQKIDTDLISEEIPIDSALINNITLDNVSNLPPGLSYSCNVDDCTWEAGAGCADIFGTPSQNGSYQVLLELTISAVIEVPFIGTQPINYPFSFDGYIINIGSVGIENYKLSHNTLKLESAFPNPSNNTTNIQYVCGQQKNIEFKLINLLGEVIASRSLTSKRGVNNISLNTSQYKKGIYIYSISDGTIVQSKRLIINH